MHALIRRTEKRITCAYQFWMNYFYYRECGHEHQRAWDMANNTL